LEVNEKLISYILQTFLKQSKIDPTLQSANSKTDDFMYKPWIMTIYTEFEIEK